MELLATMGIMLLIAVVADASVSLFLWMSAFAIVFYFAL